MWQSFKFVFWNEKGSHELLTFLSVFLPTFFLLFSSHYMAFCIPIRKSITICNTMPSQILSLITPPPLKPLSVFCTEVFSHKLPDHELTIQINDCVVYFTTPPMKRWKLMFCLPNLLHASLQLNQQRLPATSGASGEVSESHTSRSNWPDQTTNTLYIFYRTSSLVGNYALPITLQMKFKLG